MTFYSGSIPSVYQTTNFTFRPLTPEYTALDFDALMATKPELRQWSNSSWPEDDFTLEANRADLQRHYDEFLNGEAYAYTVLSPDEKRVEGCLYIDPLLQILQQLKAPAETLEQVKPDEANVVFWIRGERLAEEGLLLQDIMHWLDKVWHFPRVTFFSYSPCKRQIELFEDMGLSLRFHVPHTNGVNVLFYHKV